MDNHYPNLNFIKTELYSVISFVSWFPQPSLPLIQVNYSIAWIHHDLLIYSECWWTCELFLPSLRLLQMTCWICFHVLFGGCVHVLLSGVHLHSAMVDTVKRFPEVVKPAPLPSQCRSLPGTSPSPALSIDCLSF